MAARVAALSRGTNHLIVGIVLAVVTFWLFAQTTLNVAPTIRADLQISESLSNIAVTITALFSGIFIVVAGGLADRFGRVKLTYVGLALSALGSLLIALSPASATLSNFLLNGAAGTLLVALALVLQGAGLSSFQAGLLTLGYLVAILGTIRVGEKLLQQLGARRPMLMGCAITAAGILLTTFTFLRARQYMIVAFVGFTLFGVGLGFYATPSTDAALFNVLMVVVAIIAIALTVPQG